MLNAYLCWIDYPVLSPCYNYKYNGYHYNYYKYNYKVFNILVYYAFLLECPPVVSHLLVNCLSKISAQSPEGRWEGGIKHPVGRGRGTSGTGESILGLQLQREGGQEGGTSGTGGEAS